ncbi:MAG TPA: ATP-binding protein [Pseudonocardiaceae bacterium]
MTFSRLLDYLPRGNLLDDEAWHRRHTFLLWVLGLHVPALFLFGLWRGFNPLIVVYVLIAPALCVLLATQIRQRRVASFFASAGLVWCSAALVVFSGGSIEAHFHFFIIIGFIALYQDWVPFLWNIVFTVISHAMGTLWQAGLIFNHPDAQVNPWAWALIHGVSVLFACVGVVVFWRTTEDEQQKSMRLATQLADAELGQRKFTSELLVNLARRNQSMLYRQLDIINQLEEQERDPDALGELFRLDHLATRIRRNAESLLVLSGEEAPRVWSEPVLLIDVVRAAIAETEDLERVAFSVDERLAVLGHTVTDLTHVLAELTENAVRCSPPQANVTIRTRPYLRNPGAAVITVEDWGVGMRPDDMAQANDLLAHPRDIDLSVSQRLGLHVVARLVARHHIQVSLTPTPGSGVTAVVVLPAELFAAGHLEPAGAVPGAAIPAQSNGHRRAAPSYNGYHGVPTHNGNAAPPLSIPQPRRTGQPGLNGYGGGNGGVHARPQPDPEPQYELGPQHDPEQGNAAHWIGWWTPARLSTVESSSWQAAPVYATAEKMPPAPAPAPARVPNHPPIVASVALPARPPRWNSNDGDAVAAAPPTEHGPPGPMLNRRVPQANLAPELRRKSTETPPSNGAASAGTTAHPDAERARDALSRYQASRQAAQEQVDGSSSGSRS